MMDTFNVFFFRESVVKREPQEQWVPQDSKDFPVLLVPPARQASQASPVFREKQARPVSQEVG